MAFTDEELEKIEQAMVDNAGDFGMPESMWHPEYGWLIYDGKVTEIGKNVFRENREKHENKNNQ